MVWLVWIQNPREDMERLMAVLPNESRAKDWAINKAVELAAGSGQITESMMSDIWEAITRDNIRYTIWLQEVAYGAVEA